MTSFIALVRRVVERSLSASTRAFRLRICLITVAGFVLTAIALPGSYSSPSLGFAFWTASPILWWGGWALLQANKPLRNRVALICVGTLVAVVLVGFHLMARHAVRVSSTGGMAYLTGPFCILIGTVIATKIASSTADAPPGPTIIKFSKPPG